MYRAGIRELRSGYNRLTRQVYSRVAKLVKHIASSYIGYFGPDEFVELVGNPLTFSAICVAVGLDELSPASAVAVLSALRDSLPLSTGVAFVGGGATRRFATLEEIERAGYQMGLSNRDIEYLKHCSRMTAKVDDAAVQDGYKLWFHSMVFSREVSWCVIQIGAKSSLNRIYHWFSGRVSSRGFVDEPHSGLISDAKNRYSLDFTLHSNVELREASLDVVKTPTRRLMSVFNAAKLSQQKTLCGFLAEGDWPDINPLSAPVKVNWRLLSSISGASIRSFEELLAIRGIGSETLRFLAICARDMFGVEPCLEDRAVALDQLWLIDVDERGEELFYNLLESIRFSSIQQETSKVIVARLHAWWRPRSREN